MASWLLNRSPLARRKSGAIPELLRRVCPLQMAPMSAEPSPYPEPIAFATRIQDAARAQDFRVEPFGEIAGLPLYALTRRVRGPRPRVYLSAGIHGDEPAGPQALLSLIERGLLNDRAVWFVCPLLNPIGFTKRTRENAEGVDLNRDYKALRSMEIQAHARWLQSQPNFDVALCLHEDWEAKGYYLYELNPHQRPGRAAEILTNVMNVCPIDLATTIDGRPVGEPGVIRPADDPQLRELWPESIYLRAHHARLGYTLEAPTTLPIAQRIAAHCAAVEAVIAGL